MRSNVSRAASSADSATAAACPSKRAAIAFGEASTCAVLPRRTGSEESKDRWWLKATNASCNGARLRACTWTLPVATVGTPSRPASCANSRLRERSWRWNGRCSSTRNPSGPNADSSRRSVGSSCTPWSAQPLNSTSPAACSSSVSSGTAGGGSCLSRSSRCARVMIRHRFRHPTSFSTSNVTCRPSGRSISTPWMARSPSGLAAIANSIEPDTPL